jgi:hypothetical protein
MNLSTGEMALIFAACALVIGGVFIAWRRGWLNPKTDANPTPSDAAK